jgi:alkylation response protein AidB-like acyl-CoA dehydrogenase
MTTLVQQGAKALETIPAARPGGGFLVAPVPRGGVFAREKASEDTRAFAQAIRDFHESEILPNLEKIERKAEVEEDGKKVPYAIHLLRKLGELGALGIDIPEEHGGLGLDKTTSMLATESLGGCTSMGTTIGAHIGIGTLPIVFFGNDEQKRKYLPRLVTAELISCYALTEPNNGSDALGGKTTATLAEDGTHFVLNGGKIWITNGAWADMAIVFARYDGGPYSAFIVDLHSPGVTRGAEEKKMGIWGSSTTTLTFQDVKVPRENLLGNPGDAPKIALNILYIGRLKLGLGDLGNARYAYDRTLRFCSERKQFGQPVISFDMQKAKLAEITQWIYAFESLAYRTIGRIDEEIAARPEDRTHEEWVIDVTRRFGVECSIVKVNGSEMCAKVAYHTVRMHGGYGFSQEYHVERIARDNVVSTIYEGTNDINRLVIAGDLVKNIYGGELPFREFMEDVKARLASGRLKDPLPSGPLAAQHERVAALKRALAWIVERTLIGVGKDVRVLQQPVVAMADAMIALYAAESTLARAVDRLTAGAGEDEACLKAIVDLVIHDACLEVRDKGIQILTDLTPETRVEEELATLFRLTDAFYGHVDTFRLKRVVAERAIEMGKWWLS